MEFNSNDMGIYQVMTCCLVLHCFPWVTRWIWAATLGRWCRDTGEMVDASDAAVAPVEPLALWDLRVQPPLQPASSVVI